MRAALAQSRIETVWANDIDVAKAEAYRANYGSDELVISDVRDLRADSIPDVEVATGSFPCTDLSLAGNRRGLGRGSAPKGTYWESSMFWEFARILREMGDRRPKAVLCENVLGFASSHAGGDLREAIAHLNALGYSCEVLAIDARHFVPQSRPRMFIVGTLDPPPSVPLLTPTELRPMWAVRFVEQNCDLRLHAHDQLPPLPVGPNSLDGYVDEFPAERPEWWDPDRASHFLDSMSSVQRERLAQLRARSERTWRTAYRRTRQGRAVWEIRGDGIAGCLRTARGGSSKQALVQVGDGEFRVRWMTPREYARLMGAPDYILPPRRNQALFGFGDAVCVPVVRWLSEHYLLPLIGRTSPGLLEAA